MSNQTIFQSDEWEKFRLQTGYQKSYRIEDILILQKNLPLGRSMFYSPRVDYSQLVKIQNKDNGNDFLRQIKSITQKNKTIFYRLELDVPKDQLVDFPIGGFVKSFEEMQPEHTIKIDIANSNEDILSQMKQKGRYNIKIAQKHNVQVNYSSQIGIELDQFYNLYQTMAVRHGITKRDKKYFEGLIEILGKKDYARIYIASIEENGKQIPVAGVIATFYNNTAIYLFGGSANEYRNLMAPYILHWQIIQDAKTKGCKDYDLFGVAPEGETNHPWSGVTKFKEQFGGTREDILGSYDFLFRPLEYKIFKLAEKIRR